MKKRKVLAIALAAALMAGCTATAASAEEVLHDKNGDGKLVIYGIYKSGDQEWFLNEGEAARKVVEDAGGTFYYEDVALEGQKELDAIDRAYANGADGIVTCTPDQAMSQAIVDKCNEYGIAVVANDDALEVDGEKIAPWVGIAGYNIGESCAEWMNEYIKENVDVNDSSVGVMLMTMSTVSSCVPRTDGEYDVLSAAYPEFEKDGRLFYADYDGTTEKGNIVATDTITANPQITTWLVMGANEEGIIGAVRALETAGLDANSACVGMGAYLSAEEYEKGSCLKASPYFSDVAIGTYAVETCFKLIDGEEVEMSTAVPAEITTPDNYKEVLGLE